MMSYIVGLKENSECKEIGDWHTFGNVQLESAKAQEWATSVKKEKKQQKKDNTFKANWTDCQL